MQPRTSTVRRRTDDGGLTGMRRSTTTEGRRLCPGSIRPDGLSTVIVWTGRRKSGGSWSVGSEPSADPLPRGRVGWPCRDGHIDVVGAQHQHVAGWRHNRPVRPSPDRSPGPSPSSPGSGSALACGARGHHLDLPPTRRSRPPALTPINPSLRGSDCSSRLAPPAPANCRSRSEAHRGRAR